MHALDLHQVIAWVLCPFVFFLGVPRSEVFGLAYIAAGRLLVGTDFAYAALSAGMQPGVGGTVVPFSRRGFEVMTVALGGSASLGGLCVWSLLFWGGLRFFFYCVGWWLMGCVFLFWLASLGIQVGVMTALAPPSRKTTICMGAIPALLVATVRFFGGRV